MIRLPQPPNRLRKSVVDCAAAVIIGRAPLRVGVTGSRFLAPLELAEYAATAGTWALMLAVSPQHAALQENVH